MRITDIKTWLVTNGVYLKIITDEGVSGYGEATIPFTPQSAYGMLQDMKRYLIGEDPMRIELIWQSLFRDMFMRGGPSHMAAIAGVDMALYDLKGKALGVPAYELLGGLARDRVRLYGHVTGKTAAEMAAKAKALADSGCTMIRFRAFHGSDDRREFDYATGVAEQLEYLEAVRAAVGPKVDLIVECHGRYDLPWAVKLAKALEKYDIFFMEDPIRQENPAMMAELRRQTCVPIATGERCHHRWDFRELFEDQSINYARPDVCHCGGMSELKKIASYAQTYGVAVVPHNTQGPLGMAACMHTAFTIDNIAVVEAIFSNPANRGPKSEQFAKSWPDCVEGYALPPRGPGLGIKVDEDALDAAQADFQAPCQPKLRAFDGSVRDW
ncbi:MAG: galactonate dehydratase [Clostridiales bacterium]|jgi:galactonate dehydratase|nr:galactonate dehydratase [Clostridiales bacterium]